MQTPSVTDVSAQTGESWGSENDGGSIVWANAVPLPTAAAATQSAISDTNRSNDLTGRALTVSARRGTGAAVIRDATPLAGRIGMAEAVLDRSLAGQERSGSRNAGAASPAPGGHCRCSDGADQNVHSMPPAGTTGARRPCRVSGMMARR